MPDFDFFKKSAERNFTPKGSVRPKPPGWKGKGDRTHKASVILAEKDFNKPVTVVNEKGEVRKRTMTPKQKLVAQYLLQGYSRRQAMIRAGYGKKVVEINNTPKYNRTALAFVETMQDRLEKRGVTQDKLAEKLHEMLDAEKTTVGFRIVKHKDGTETHFDPIIDPDYETQIKAYDRIEKIFNPPSKGGDAGKKREISFTEWINGDRTVTEGEVQNGL